MTALWVLPSVDAAWGDACLASLRVPFVLRVDNTVENLGVQASWNAGIRAAEGLGADYLVLCSESVRFGAPGGQDFERQLDGRATLSVGIGWHLIALAMSTVRTVGEFDEQFFPGYMGDCDYMHRLRLAGLGLDGQPPVTQVHVDCVHVGIAHAINTGLVPRPDFDELRRQYARKWGGIPTCEVWNRPYDDPALDWTCKPGLPERATTFGPRPKSWPGPAQH